MRFEKKIPTDKTKWHDWFAWFPVRVETIHCMGTESAWVWFETVERRIDDLPLKCYGGELVTFYRRKPYRFGYLIKREEEV